VLASCGKTAGLQCTTVTVPLDRTGAVPGTIALHVEVLPPDGASRGVVFLFAGGPGQGSARTWDLGDPDSADFRRFLFPGYTLVAFDNRGTGASGLINCPGLQTVIAETADQDAALARDCAATIGPSRAFYATRDHAEDTEAVRRALGFGKIALYGVSYGTKQALAYALAYPQSVERLVLDSVVPTDLPDPYEANVLQQMPKTLSALCVGVCRTVTHNLGGEVAALANKLEAKPAVGTVLTMHGKRKTLRMNGEDLLSVIVDTDLNPGLAAELPAAVRSARAGYTLPLLRLYQFDLESSLFSAADLSFGLYAATTCADGEFPWAPGTPVSERTNMLDAAIAGLPSGALGPFGKWAAQTGTAVFCKLWPSPAGRAPLGAGPLPNVPMLALSGGVDMRTPTASAVAVARLFPQGHVLVVPGVGHDVLDGDFSLCSQRALRNWLSTGTVRSSCPRAPALVSFVESFPRAGKALPRPTLVAVARTVRDAEATWIQTPGGAVPGGVYGGRLVPTSDGGFRLTNYSSVRGVRVTGKLSLRAGGPPFTFGGTLKVSGSSAARGNLRLVGNAVSGTLAGRRVSGRL
jgi:pimeloyl-ACP methyl ester carboxylesterase